MTCSIALQSPSLQHLRPPACMSDHLNELLIQRWVEGSLSDVESDNVESHLTECEECAAKVPELELDGTDSSLVHRMRDLDLSTAGTRNASSRGTKVDDGLRSRFEKPGGLIGSYKLLQLLGEGGMGSVWMVEQSKPVKRTIALKIIKAGMDTKEVIARFESERQALALMDHPNIAKVLDVGATESGRPYFVMDLVKGIPITEFCDQSKASPDRRLRLFCDVCGAVQHAHRKGIIHRDIKPTNILVTIEDGKPIPKVIDFGLAKATGARLTEKTMFTALGQMVGTPAYMSPEQAEASGLDVDTRTDVYSLGVLLYELLTGVTPLDVAKFQEAGYAEVQRLIREEDPKSPSTRLSSERGDSKSVAERRDTDPQSLIKLLRGDLDVIVMKALEKDRGRRYESPSEFASDLRRYLQHEPIQARSPSVGYRLKRLYQRNRVAMLTAMLVVASLILGTITSTVLAIKANRAETLASKRLEKVVAEQRKTEAALNSVQRERDRAIAAEQLAKRRRASVELAQQETRVALGKTKAALKELESVTKALAKILRGADPVRDDRALTVAEMLDRAVSQIESIDNVAQQIRLKTVIADSYRSLGLYKSEVPLREQIYEYWSEQASSGKKLSDAKWALGICYSDVGRKKEAKSIQEEILRHARQQLGESHPTTIAARMNVENGMPSGPAKLRSRRETFELANEVLGPAHPTTLKCMNNLAISIHEDGGLSEAIQLSEKVLELRREHLGANHPDTLFIIRGLLLYYRQAGLSEKEATLAEENYGLSRKTLGPEHPGTIVAMARLSGAYENNGRVDEAIDLRERVLVLRKQVFGPDSSQANSTRSYLSLRYGVHGRHDQALKLGNELLKLTTKANGVESKAVFKVKNSVAFALAVSPGADANQLDLALKYAEEVTEKRPKTATYWNTYGYVLYRLERWNESMEATNKSMKLQKGGGGALDRLLLAMTYWKLDEKEKATSALKDADEFLKSNPEGKIWVKKLRQEAILLIETPDTEE